MTERLGQSMAAQRDFVANAAHQLRTPLTGLRLRLEAAGLKTDDDALRRDLEAGEREAERLARTVTDLLTLAREGQRPDRGRRRSRSRPPARPRSSAGSRSPTSTASTSSSATAVPAPTSTPRARTSP